MALAFGNAKKKSALIYTHASKHLYEYLVFFFANFITHSLDIKNYFGNFSYLMIVTVQHCAFVCVLISNSGYRSLVLFDCCIHLIVFVGDVEYLSILFVYLSIRWHWIKKSIFNSIHFAHKRVGKKINHTEQVEWVTKQRECIWIENECKRG